MLSRIFSLEHPGLVLSGAPLELKEQESLVLHSVP